MKIHFPRYTNKTAAITAILLIPLIIWLQQTTHFIPVKGLKGAFKEATVPKISGENWLNGQYQSATETYLSEHFGFRSLFTRFNNELSFELFGEGLKNNILVGKEHYLYEQNYIDAYYGLNFIGEERMKAKVYALQQTRNILNAAGKELLVMIAPGKASYFPEFLPKSHLLPADSTNYKSFIRLLKKHQIPTLDIKQWFAELKNQTPYPLFNRTGVHWTLYGGYLAADTLIRQIEQLRDIDLPDLVVDRIETSYKPRKSDDDIEQTLNLLTDIPTRKLAYPITHIDTTNKQKLKALVIGDSFYWTLYHMNISNQVFNQGDFWYYYNKRYNFAMNLTRMPLTDINIDYHFRQYDLIILETNEPNIGGFPWGFTEDILQLPPDYLNMNLNELTQWNLKRSDKVKYYSHLIKNNPKWMAGVEKKALDRKIPLDSMIYRDALFMANRAMKEE